jgi:hypothetical protein
MSLAQQNRALLAYSQLVFGQAQTAHKFNYSRYIQAGTGNEQGR